MNGHRDVVSNHGKTGPIANRPEMQLDLGWVTGADVEGSRHDDGISTEVPGSSGVVEHAVGRHVDGPGQDRDLARVGLDGDLQNGVTLSVGQKGGLARGTQHEEPAYARVKEETDQALEGQGVHLAFSRERGADWRDYPRQPCASLRR